MGDRIKMLFVVFLFVPFFLLGEEVQLNLPEKFDVKVSKRWSTINGKKIDVHDRVSKKELNRPIIFHFNGENFKYVDQKHTQYGNGDYVWSFASGTFKNGILKGKGKWKTIRSCDNNRNLVCSKSSSSFELNGKTDSEGLIHIVVSQERGFDYVYYRLYSNGKLTIWTDGTSDANRVNANISAYKDHYILQLPVGELQSSQTPIPDTPTEPEPIQEQPVTIPKTDLTAEAGISADNQTEETPPPQKEIDHCAQKPIEDAWKEYCEAKAYNAKIRQEEEAEAKAAEQEAKEEEAYQKRLDAWNEEERQSNIEFIKSQEAQRKKAREIWKEEDKAFNESVAKEQAERKAKQAEIEKAHKIIDRFGDNYETQSEAHKKIDYLAQTANAKQAKKIKNAVRKRFYDSKQIKRQGKAEFYTNVANELDKSAKKAEVIRNTAVTANKVLATVYGGAIIEGIAQVHESATNAIDAAEKDGWEGALVSVVKDGVNSKTFNMGGDRVDQVFHSTQLHTKKGALVPEDMKVYDKNGYLVKRIKANETYYDKKGKNISFAVKRKVLLTKSFIAKSEDDFKKGDVNKKVNTFLDVWGTTTDIVGGAIDLFMKR